MATEAWLSSWYVLAPLAAVACAYAVAVVASWRFGAISLAVLLPFQGLLGSGGQWSVFKLATFLVAASLLLRLSKGVTAPHRMARLLRTRTVILLGIFVAWSFASMVWAGHPSAALGKSTTYLGDFLLLLIVGMLDQRTLRRFFWVFLVTWALAVPTGMVVSTFNSYSLDRFNSAGLYTAGGYNPDAFGGYLVMAVLLLIFGFGFRRQRALKLAMLTSFVVGVFYAEALTAIVALALAPGLAVWSGNRAGRAGLALKTIGAYAVAASVVLAALTVAPVGGYLAQSKYVRLTALSTGGAWDGRLSIWEGGLRMFKEHPLVGVGSGNFGYLSPIHSTFAAHMQSDQEAFTDKFSTGSPAHNMYLSVAAELGSVGLVLFLAALAFAFVGSRRFYEPRTLAAGVHAALCVLLIGGLALNWEYSKFLFLILGAIDAQRLNARARDSGAEAVAGQLELADIASGVEP